LKHSSKLFASLSHVLSQRTVVDLLTCLGCGGGGGGGEDDGGCPAEYGAAR